MFLVLISILIREVRAERFTWSKLREGLFARSAFITVTSVQLETLTNGEREGHKAKELLEERVRNKITTNNMPVILLCKR